MLRKYADLGAGLFLLALSVALFIASQHVKTLSVSSIGSGFFPAVVAVILALDSLAVIVEALVELGRHSRPGEPTGGAAGEQPAPKPKSRTWAVWATFALMAFYAGLMPVLGFMITTAVYLFGQMQILAESAKRRHFLFAGISLVTAVVVNYLFIQVFHLMLPRGILG